MVLSWLAARLLGYAMARLRQGDTRLITALYASDVELTFPGDNSFSGVYRGKASVSAWLARFAALGFQIFPDEIVAVGPPWHTTVGVRGHVWLRDERGETVYENRYVIWGALRWGRMHRYEVYEDTRQAEAADRWVAAHRPGLAVPVPRD